MFPSNCRGPTRQRIWPGLIAVATLGLVLMAASPGAAQGCRIEVRLSNQSGQHIRVRARHVETRTRVAGVAGPWRALTAGGWSAGQAEHTLAQHRGYVGTYNPALGCGDRRQYRLTYSCIDGPNAGQTRVFHWPPNNGWQDGHTSVSLWVRPC